jgi:hypothetical protein
MYRLKRVMKLAEGDRVLNQRAASEMGAGIADDDVELWNW